MKGEVAFVLICILVLGSFIGYGFAWIVSRTETVVTVDKMWIKGYWGEDRFTQMYLFSDTEGNVYRITDEPVLLIFDASNRWAIMHEGERYTIITYGWRITWLSLYPNAVWVIPEEK